MITTSYTKFTAQYKSNDKISTITYYVYKPNGIMKGILQIAHGMNEYLERYEHFIDYLTENGFLVCGNDHLGHGNSIKNVNELGFFSERNGASNLIKDVQKLTYIIRKKYPSLPYYLLGHSMGSFIVRNYITKSDFNLSGVILSGTAGPNKLSALGDSLISFIIKCKGSHYRSKTFNRLFFRNFNKYYKNEVSLFSWLSRDHSVVRSYIHDPKCNFIFTGNGFLNVIQLQRKCTNKNWYHKLPLNLPILIVSGDMDPVGNYGKGVQHTYYKLIQTGISSVTLRQYKGARHEVLNEINREEVYNDILKWMNLVISY